MIKKILGSLVLILNIILGISYYQNVVNNEIQIIEEFRVIQSNNESSVEFIDIEIYLPSDEGDFLTRDLIMIDKNSSKERKIEEIFNNLKFKSSEIPLGSNIKNVFFEGKRVYINMNYQIVNNMTSPEKEMLIIYSIVNSLVNLEYVEEVKFLRENKETEFVGNFIRANDFFRRNNLLVRGDS